MNLKYDGEDVAPSYLTWVFYTLCVLIVSAPLVFSFHFTTYNAPKYALVQILTGLMLLGIFFEKMQGTSPGGLRTPLDLPLILFLGWSCLSSLHAVNFHESLRFILQQLAFVALYFVVTRTVRKKEEILKILWISVSVGFLVALYGLFQYITSERPVSERYLDVKSTLGYPNYVGQYLILVLPLAVFLLCVQRDLKTRAILKVFSGVLLAGLLVTRSRGAWLGLGSAFFLGAALLFNRSLSGVRKPGFLNGLRIGPKKLAALLLILAFWILLSLAFVPPFHRFVRTIFTDISTILDPTYLTNAIRLLTWKATLQMVQDHPWLGVGAGNFKLFYPLYRPQEERELSGSNTWMVQTHNDYLQILAELGPLGLLLFLWIIYRILRVFTRSMAQVLTKEDRYLLAGMGVGILATLIHTFFDFNLQNPVSGSYFWILVGLLVAYGNLGGASVIHNVADPVFRIPPAAFCATRDVLYNLQAAALVGGAVGIFFLGKPLIADYHLRQAELGSIQGRVSEALAHLEKAGRQDPYDINIRFFEGKVYEEAGDYDKAIRAYRACLNLHPYYENAYNNLGTALAKKGLYPEAEESYRKSLEINPYFVESHQNLGLVYYHLNQPENARFHLEKVLSIRPATPATYKILGLVYGNQLKDYEKAIYYWETYLKLNPQDKDRAALQREIDRMKKTLER